MALKRKYFFFSLFTNLKFIYMFSKFYKKNFFNENINMYIKKQFKTIFYYSPKLFKTIIQLNDFPIKSLT